VTTLKLKGRRVVEGYAEGTAIVSQHPISFYGGVDPKTGCVVERGHELEGRCVSGLVLVFPMGKGSTVGSYTLYQMKKSGTAPKAIINRETEIIIATGCALAGIPLVDRLEKDPLEEIEIGDHVKVDADKGEVEIEKAKTQVAS
jgi:predicted aconitase with swiveling domain